MNKLTEKQKLFIDEYLIDLNATQAAIRAGYSKKTAFTIGAENLKKPLIKQIIDERMAEKKSRLIAQQDEVLEYLTGVMRGEVKEETLRNSGDFEQEVIEVKPGVTARNKAAELLGKRYGTFVDRVEQTNNNIEINVGEFEDDD